MTSLPRRAVRRARGVRRRASDLAFSMSSPRRTALRVPPGQDAPPSSAFAAFGANSWLVPPTRTRNSRRISIGRDVTVLEFSTLWVSDNAPPGDEPLLSIGDRVRFTRFTSIVCEVGVTIGDSVASSDHVAILDTWRNPLAGFAAIPNTPPPDPAPVVIDAGAYLGMNCIVGPGVHVGAGAFIGEGAVVFDDVPAHSVVYGNPAVVTRRYDPLTRTWEGPQWP